MRLEYSNNFIELIIKERIENTISEGAVLNGELPLL